MKLTKLSLVAALLMGTSAFAIDNIKMSGDARVYYSTTDGADLSNAVGGTKASLFDKDSSAADIGLNLNISADLAKNDLVTVSAGAGFTALTTLGLENNFVSNVWGGSHVASTNTGASYGNNPALGALDPEGAQVENSSYFNEAWVAVTAGKSTVKLGRMELDTPIAFSETWSIEKNTFEAAVLLNQDIPDTTVVAAFVGRGNGTEQLGGQDLRSNIAPYGGTGSSLAMGSVVNGNGQFSTYGQNGAYALGVVNNSVEPLTVQAWYYDVSKVVSSYWLQADVNFEGILFGAQYNAMNADATGAKEDNVYALMAGYEMKDVVTVKLAYSAVNNDGSVQYAGMNTATDKSTAQSKLYTEAWWSYGQVTASGASAITFSAEAPIADIVDLGLFVTSVDHDDKVDFDNTTPGIQSKSDVTEVTLTASKSFGPLDTELAYINTDTSGADAVNMVQAYLTLNF